MEKKPPTLGAQNKWEARKKGDRKLQTGSTGGGDREGIFSGSEAYEK